MSNWKQKQVSPGVAWVIIIVVVVIAAALVWRYTGGPGRSRGLTEEQRKQLEQMFGGGKAPGPSAAPGQRAPAQSNSSGAVTTTGPASNSKLDLELVEAKAETDKFGNVYIVGSVRNNTNRTYHYVQIEINLYDKSGAQVESTLDNVNNLEPGAVWKFKAPVLKENAAGFRIINIFGF